MTDSILNPALEKIIFSQISLDRTLDDVGMPAKLGNADFTLSIAGELAHVARAPQDRLLTVAKLKLQARTSEEGDNGPLKASIVAHAYFKHEADTTEEDVKAFNKTEENLVRLLMQVYPATIMKLTGLIESAGFTGIKMAMGMPPRSQKLKPPGKKPAARKKAK